MGDELRAGVGGDASVFGAAFKDEPEGLRKDQGSRGLLCMANSGEAS